MKKADFAKLIINTYARIDSGWCQGVTVLKKNMLLGCSDATRMVGTIDLLTHAIKFITVSGFPDELEDLKDLSLDPWTGRVWVSAQGNWFWSIDANTWTVRKEVPRPTQNFGIFVDRDKQGILWSASQNRSRIEKISMAAVGS